MFKINEVLKNDGSLFRVLSLHGEELIWIGVDDPKAFPSIVLVRELLKGFDDGTLSRADDPFAELAFSTPEQGSMAQVKRDKNYDLIKDIVNDPSYYDPKVRGALIAEAVEKKHTSLPHLYKMIRRYWQRGQSPNALLPDYKNSGGKGKKRKATTKKLGRPRKYMPGVGALVDEQTERLFRIAINTYLLKDKESSFSFAYDRFVDLYNNHFPDIPESEVPTSWQMLHFYKREFGTVEKLKKRTSSTEYNKDIRPILSTANVDALGPGSRYEIDATIADIYLVSDSDRRNIVGRPVIYFVIDVFSRMITGLYVGFENASYPAALQALAVSMTDKVQFCKEYGIDISEEEWPSVGLPDAILADRGELLGHQIESLEACFSIRIENTPPYRGDAKGIVERHFRTIQAKFKPFAPGVVEKTIVKKRGGRDYRLDAKLTVRAFKEIILSSVLVHNQYKVLGKYDRNSDMPTDLEMTPLSLWNWGLQHRTGRLRTAPEEAIRIGLMPREEASVSELGVSVFGVHYTSREIVERGWLHRGKGVRRPVGLQAAYDPSSADTIYLFPPQSSGEYWPCNLAQRSREFAGASFWDVWQIKDKQKKATAQSQLQMGTHRRKLQRFIADKIKEAEERAPDTDGVSNARRIGSIRKNKEQEKRRERSPLISKPPQQDTATGARITPIHGNGVESGEYPDFIEELFGDEES